MITQDDKERLLSILHAHGQQFLRAFNTPAASQHEAKDSDGSESEEEWAGFGLTPSGTLGTASDGGYDDFERENDSNDSAVGPSRTPDVTVFLESTRKQHAADVSAKELGKSFMSSKVSNITSSIQPVSKGKMSEGESEDEHTNTQNDALLHRLVHTKLLSGSLNTELNLNHAQKGKALAGRILELAGEAKLGKGENVFRQEQHSKAAKRVRDGLIRKRREQEQKILEEAKNLGNYHPTLKRLYDSSLSSVPRKKRVRGLRMGIGRFVGGTLKLSREEIASVTGPEKRSRDKSRRGMRQRT